MGQVWRSLLDVIAATLVFFYELVPSYGVAIILLTVVVGILLFPLTLKQTRSMRSMAELQPEVKRLQKEFKEDKERLNQELMRLYRERGVNPASGCLPLILQAPIWFALFTVLRQPDLYIDESSGLASAIATNARFLGMDLKHSPSFIFAESGIVELAPYLLLILIVVGTAFYQQHQATAVARQPGQELTPQARQMQTITRVMPLMFGVFSWTFPTGLVLYFAASNIFRIGQQTLMFRLEERDKAAAARRQTEQAAEQGEVEADEPPARPHPRSKRRKRRKKR